MDNPTLWLVVSLQLFGDSAAYLSKNLSKLELGQNLSKNWRK